MLRRFITVNAAAIGLFGSTALAQPQAQTPPAQATPPTPAAPDAEKTLEQATTPWTINVEPAAWFVGAGGRLKMPRSATAGTPNSTTDISNLNLDNPRFVPFGEVNARNGDWRFAIRGFVYDAEKTASGHSGQIGDVLFSRPDTLSSTLSFASYEFAGAYTVAGRPLNKYEDGFYAIDTKLDIVAGLRLYDAGWDVRNTTAAGGTLDSSFSGVFAQPEVGFKLNMDLGRYCTIDCQITVGGMPLGSSTSYSADIIAGFMYRPIPHVGVQIGYRSLFFGMGRGSGEGEFSFNGAMQGLYGGLDLRF